MSNSSKALVRSSLKTAMLKAFLMEADFVPNLVHGLADGAVQYIGQHQSHQADDDDNGAKRTVVLLFRTSVFISLTAV